MTTSILQQFRVHCCVPQRYVCTVLGLLLTIIAALMKYSVSIALTQMTVMPESHSINAVKGNSTNNSTMCPYTTQPSVQRVLPSQVEGKFEWSEKTQGLIFGSFFWTYVPLQLPLGHLVDVVGPRYLLALGMLLASTCYILTPLAVFSYDALGFILVRVLTGVGLAPCYPCSSVILSKWAPASMKCRLGSIIYAGENIGCILSMALSGCLLDHPNGDWSLVFYVYGGAGLVWLLLWCLLGYDDPHSHPFITSQELAYLEERTPKATRELPPTPWISMLRSAPLWGTLVAQMGHDWGMITIVTELPKYMKTVLHYDIQTNGMLSAIPYAVMAVVAVMSGWFSDWQLKRNWLTITGTRKLYTTIAAVGPSIGLVGAIYAGCDSFLVVSMFTLGTALMGFYYPSLCVNTLDLSPNYSGTLMGVAALGGLSGILCPYVSGVLVPDGTISQWRYVFWVAVATLIVTNIFYLAVGSGDVQPWNDPIELRSPKLRIQDDNDVREVYKRTHWIGYF